MPKYQCYRTYHRKEYSKVKLAVKTSYSSGSSGLRLFSHMMEKLPLCLSYVNWWLPLMQERYWRRGFCNTNENFSQCRSCICITKYIETTAPLSRICKLKMQCRTLNWECSLLLHLVQCWVQLYCTILCLYRILCIINTMSEVNFDAQWINRSAKQIRVARCYSVQNFVMLNL